MTPDQWLQMRREWEASERKGLTWLTTSAGGAWDVSEETIRKRRADEGWTKPANIAAIVQRAQKQADVQSAARLATDPHPAIPGANLGNGVGDSESESRPPKSQPAPGTEEAAVDMRSELLERHRREWSAIRKLFYRTLKAAEEADGLTLAKLTMLCAGIAERMQRNEARAWGLDAAVLDFDSMSEEQLEAVVKHGRLPR